MNFFQIYFVLILLSISEIKSESTKKYLRAKDVEEGIYNFILQKRFSILTYLDGLRTSREKYGYSLLNFKITFSSQNTKKYFYIYHMHSKLYIGVNKDPRNTKDFTNLQIGVNHIIKNKEKNSYSNYEWKFIKTKGKANSFVIKNKLGCVLNEIKNKFFCSFNVEGTVFTLFKIYQEKEKIMSEDDKKILEAEPIDVFIKYIDIHDPELNRSNLVQINKDYENEELKYCIRSVLKNIPWIRKIFILMPNEKVRFFKNYSEINEKIVYVKDKDILGHESANIHAFQFRIWKLKEYGLSENFISLDDDYFIGKPLEKSDFFYVENNTVYPLIINTNLQAQTLNAVKANINTFSQRISSSSRTQTSDEFSYTVYRTYYFFIKYFQSHILAPLFTHNAIPVKAQDLQEIFELIDKSEEFRYPTLYSLHRHSQSLQYQTAYVVYAFNKYKRRVNKIKHGYIDVKESITANFDFPLFCINTGGDGDYNQLSFMKMKVTMEKLFPIPTKYEIFDTKSLAESAFNVLKRMEDENKKLRDKKKEEELEKEEFMSERILKKYEKLNNQVLFLQSEKRAYNIKGEKIKLELEKCNKELNSKEKKLNGLGKVKNDYSLFIGIKNELNNVNRDNYYYENKINEYKNRNEEYLDKIKKNKNNENLMLFMIYFEFVLIIGIILAFWLINGKKNKEINFQKEVVRYNRFKSFS